MKTFENIGCKHSKASCFSHYFMYFKGSLVLYFDWRGDFTGRHNCQN